jgi:DNA topoisomerase I
MTELIITEKPNASKRIADALSDSKIDKIMNNGVPYYAITHKGKEIIIASAVGHLFGLTEKVKTKNFQYPVFDIEWKPASEISKKADFTKKYANTLKKASKNIKEIIVATDYDVEGEVIGLNVVRFICHRNDAKRMKFSTLTEEEIKESYKNASKTLDWAQAIAGETRHFLDFYYGINLSRALMSAIQKTGTFKILSTGRVQGPALKIIVDREKEILNFKPIPYWQITLDGKFKKDEISAIHEKDKFWEKKEAEQIHSAIKDEKKGIIAEVLTKKFNQEAPKPFDLTTLQTESFKCFSIKPKQTLDIAQELYTNGLISYPRTSSQQLPPSINYKKILQSLSRQNEYKKQCETVLKSSLKPNNGKKTDPAHPAIYPTGLSGDIKERHFKIYDLIVKRFLATFGETAERETITVKISIKKEIFITKGTRTTKKGWHELYSPYVKLEETELPLFKEKDEIDIKKINFLSEETKPPKRYTHASLIKELEKRGLGTKATRAQIVETLFQRNYVDGESLEATQLGINNIEILEKYCPKIVDEALTKHFENDMEEIREKKKKKDEVLSEARDVLTEILAEFKTKEKKIGEELKKSFTETRSVLTTVGKCKNCKDGMLIIRTGRYGKFIACDKYPDCKTAFNLPKTGSPKITEKICPVCNYPMIKIIKAGKQPQEMCINPKCPTKESDEKKEGEGKPCPKCGKGKIVAKRGFYGEFLACDQYPKCKHTEAINSKKQYKKEDNIKIKTKEIKETKENETKKIKKTKQKKKGQKQK